MFQFQRRFSIDTAASATAILGFILACSGCGQPTTETAPPASAATSDADAHDDHAHDGHTHGAGGEVAAAMDKLSPDDRALAEAQHVCVVSGEPLGSMGAPIRVEHDGQVAFLCCDGCVEAFEGDPETYLAKLKENSDAGAEGTTEPAAEGADAEPATEAPGEAN